MPIEAVFSVFVTVNICTWNRAGLLRRTLDQMTHLVIPDKVEWELVVVNNNCTDDTDRIVAEFRHRLPIVYVHEPKSGKSNALNLAIECSRGELILFTDDDALVSERWLERYCKAANDKPRAAFFGGPVTPWFEAAPPRWLRKHIHRVRGAYALIQGPEHTCEIIDQRKTPYGVNMAIRASVLKKEYFDIELGPSEDSEVRGEESELLRRLMKKGIVGVWVADNPVRHFIPVKRCSVRFLYKFYRGFGIIAARKGMDPESFPWWALRMWCTESLSRIFWAPFCNERWLLSLQRSAWANGQIWEWNHQRKYGNRSMARIEPASFNKSVGSR